MPIDKVSNVRRIPRLGKIRLGIKETSSKTGNPYPKATDYFVVPPEVAEALGTDKPKELPIMFPCEDEAQFAQQWLRCYSQTQGLVCVGDGITARRKIDKETGNIANHNTKDWVWKDSLTCNPEECPLYNSKRCRRVMNLQFLMPTVPGLGVWQIDTSSFWSIVHLNSMLDMLRNLCGRISFIPLTLALSPMEVTPPGGTKKTVYVMHIKQDIKLSELQAWGRREPTRVLLPEPITEEPPEDLFPREILAEGEGIPERLPVETPAAESSPSVSAGAPPVEAPIPPPEEMPPVVEPSPPEEIPKEKSQDDIARELGYASYEEQTKMRRKLHRLLTKPDPEGLGYDTQLAKEYLGHKGITTTQEATKQQLQELIREVEDMLESGEPPLL